MGIQRHFHRFVHRVIVHLSLRGPRSAQICHIFIILLRSVAAVLFEPRPVWECKHQGKLFQETEGRFTLSFSPVFSNLPSSVRFVYHSLLHRQPDPGQTADYLCVNELPVIVKNPASPAAPCRHRLNIPRLIVFLYKNGLKLRGPIQSPEEHHRSPL
ncbi:hypothetical protein F7725_004017 [Dissostichus mawsoni]|uniref:Uncharacterized protein n=1 Tax=Dissostichus mawsoni TaxID=36200 RepID=A0A7J5YDT4_DISMA|nr:hypothetical protein F7725_004017 [Dissostichus mawsoni]